VERLSIEYRAEYELIMDGVLSKDLLRGVRGKDKRTQALVRVLCAIPEREYRILRDKFPTEIGIEIPSKRLLGHVRYTEGEKAVMYLFPILEDKPFSEVLRVVGHELSHCLLHSEFSSRAKGLIEKEADLKALEWGF
jgi:hypothetical protein